MSTRTRGRTGPKPAAQEGTGQPPANGERMGASGRRTDESAVVWSEVGRYYLELCAAQFPQLTELRW